ncbi:MAG: tRNA adenylyl-/cytidylyl-transferase [Candidatus Woesebacteria bacterium GW2011_GWA1_33_30]|uniref:tRNA adenylyl-/cytidylyl-transferase n=1 Tax=Candidatus Woesebacteria bacterium GW2011_GWA2_33_28 TaxID=1618561 RepID=A0A0G0CWJ5_9BACT|nr:MAG: tRNA adenylyl-/cytidylyl-transferase [Candidatus Woesebacteria bacterium GW2011_GWA2_33_28]KKP48624.1 MAG: tRNA adenylyl-/cytidylyl-transferase [Candidatus Woesebacteria bacterium GW2011_GWA1_33_30]KKP49763.1 MAG: tRNA adenylyl-/cytidylyl-transferase [Microgenomates group bacterium GW2011_GWC1_33_32]KKP52380.1 MAG: tRNA adenylyl-/cytidylyl-transferase [Candidatus Woesebacteria bacterium GW2011_GWB1_33_38]KKP57110.1 MAG: tRNA adenylyl-/cytidylyl-transferase [Microgenomates group bacteriu
MTNFKLPDEVKQFMAKFAKANFEIYVVGGAVRDALMGHIVYDWDFTTNAQPSEILTIYPDGFYDNSFGTVGISFENLDRPFEITTFRTEHGYSDNRRPDKVIWGKTLEEDLARRDFTVNALALQCQMTNDKCQIIDKYSGLDDLKNKLIRAVGDPSERFNEDALRMMRAVRIGGELNFEIEKNTLEAIKTNSTLINKIAKERIKDELFKILKSINPYNGIVLLKDTGLMQEILPELMKCFGVEQKSPQRHHIYDVGNHLLMSLKECKSEDPVTRFATLIHDIGKPQTYKKLDSGIITFYNHEMVSTKIAINIADRLRFSAKEKEKFVKLVRFHQFTVDEHQTDSAIRRFLRNIGLENVEDMLALRVADRLGGGARETSWRLEEFKTRLVQVQKQPFSIKDLKVNGKDVMEILKIPSGPKVGEILEKLFNEVVENKFLNERGVLLKQIKELK